MRGFAKELEKIARAESTRLDPALLQAYEKQQNEREVKEILDSQNPGSGRRAIVRGALGGAALPALLNLPSLIEGTQRSAMEAAAEKNVQELTAYLRSAGIKDPNAAREMAMQVLSERGGAYSFQDTFAKKLFPEGSFNVPTVPTAEDIKPQLEIGREHLDFYGREILKKPGELTGVKPKNWVKPEQLKELIAKNYLRRVGKVGLAALPFAVVGGIGSHYAHKARKRRAKALLERVGRAT